MKLTVAIPAYNAARTIKATVDSVLRQTLAPEEIIVVDDGSTDETASILSSYGRAIRVIRQKNQGNASARNRGYLEARGELIAWLDADDLWHPTYLEAQTRSFRTCPELAASFTAHVDFYGYGEYAWPESPPAELPLSVIDPLSFLKRYHTETGVFGSPSFMCIPKRVLSGVGDEPFKGGIAADAYLCTWLPLLGPVGYTPARLGAYRITQGSISSDRVKTSGSAVEMFEHMSDYYNERASGDLLRAFQSAFVSQRRHHAKRLMGVGLITEARKQLRTGLFQSGQTDDRAKSFGLLVASYMPRRMQPCWPSPQRDWRDPIIATPDPT